ncbi:glycosyltransferase family 2 protein [Prauserella muralis]|uniref:Glycosyl transferase n=1 Tax=Prauserella muralis TaxID=588067 RepID=A0A2V4B003_9PSEU|nr:glycosyltransferase [Prauserella muralis]PXY27323.1 glycosyl transferase [Prauserella muralis]TWE22996.1 GT2 family glycosyltransferase [Prauserella muralis]
MRTTVVIATRNRADELLRTLARLRTLRPVPPIIVVDNASTDGTATLVREQQPGVRVVSAPENRAAAARNLGVEAAGTPYVAFSDDDSWWAPGALARAEALFAEHPRLGLLAGRTLVGEQNRPDPVCELMAKSPLGTPPGAPGPLVLGFLACSAIVRRDAFLDVGGFSELLHFGAEEKLLSYDLAARGWWLCYADDVVAHHHPSPSRPAPAWRRSMERRNNALIAWLRRPPHECVRAAGPLLRDPGAAVGALRRLPHALTRRHRLPRTVEQQIRELA